jgi:hypothetical protein
MKPMVTFAYDPAEFSDSTEIDNPYFPLTPGTTFVYRDAGEGLVSRMHVTQRTVVVDGVTCVVIHDVSILDGKVVEDTFDWYAQDDSGNVWYFGEYATHFNADGTVTHEGSWRAGVDGARPGVVMMGSPGVGDVYYHEFWPGFAMDQARVANVDATVNLSHGPVEDALATVEFTRLDPGVVENKYYVPGVGLALTTDPVGARKELVQVIVNGEVRDDLWG